jgi:mannose-6-phosphate isomerase-like protein (cupin superfamily)
VEPIFVAAGDGNPTRVPGETFFVKASGDATGDLLALAEGEFAPRHGTFLHRHMKSGEAFYILHGTFVIDVDGQERELGPGGFAFAPPGATHRITNIADEPGRVIGLYSPAGPERGFRAVRERIAELGALPPPEEVEAILAANDIVRVGPARMRFDD